MNSTTQTDFREKARLIVQGLSLEEKVWLMSGKMTFDEVRASIKKQSDHHYNHIPYPSGGLEEHGVSPMLFCDGPRGVVCGTGKSTCFPVSMLRGASFDAELEEKIGEAIGREVLGYGGNLFAGVCINLLYHPGWGRAQETYGEESFHLGEMGAALTRGVQSKGVMACVKHYAFNQMENSRFKVDIDCSKRTEREVFLPHFKKCIDNGAASVMTSYNKYKGPMCGHNSYLIRDVLKKEWNFDGFVMSDFVWGVKNTVEAACGGQDIEMCCTKYYGGALVDAVREGKVPEEAIDEAAVRIISTIQDFEKKKQPGDPESIGSPEHIALALQSAREGMTLLKNENSTLPLNREKCRKIVVLGRLAAEEVTGDKGSSEVHPAYIVTPLKGIVKAAGDCEVTFYEGSDLDHCRELAESADAVIFVAGYDFNDEGEFVAEDKKDAYTGAIGGDRKGGLTLHREEEELIRTIAPLNSNSTVVLIGGSMIMMEEWIDSVSSLIMAYYPGMEGGTALGEILFGDVNPSGKLPFVVPTDESHLPEINWDTESQNYDFLHGYVKLEAEGITPRFPFGYGLSYTDFEYSGLSVSQDEEYLYAECTVSNTGERSGEEAVQMYVGFPESKVERPVKILRGFKRISLKPGESSRVSIECRKSELSWYNEVIGKFEFEEMNYRIYLGSSSDNKDLIQKEIFLS